MNGQAVFRLFQAFLMRATYLQFCFDLGRKNSFKPN